MLSISLTTILAIVAYTAGSAIPSDSSAILSDSLFQRDLKFCPGLNNYIYTSESGATKWRINCEKDIPDGKHAVVRNQTDTFEDCIKLCGTSRYNSWCRSVVWQGAINHPNTCYMKDTTTGVKSNEGWRVAVKQ